MIAKTVGKAKFYLWDRDLSVFETIDASEITVEFVNRIPTYKLKQGNRNVIIVQALNEKKAAAKMLTKIRQDASKSTGGSNQNK